MTTEAPAKTIHIFINGHKFDTDSRGLTGAEIRALGNVPAGETLYLRHGDKEDIVTDDEVVKLRNGLKFESAPDGGVS